MNSLVQRLAESCNIGELFRQETVGRRSEHFTNAICRSADSLLGLLSHPDNIINNTYTSGGPRSQTGSYVNENHGINSKTRDGGKRRQNVSGNVAHRVNFDPRGRWREAWRHPGDPGSTGDGLGLTGNLWGERNLANDSQPQTCHNVKVCDDCLRKQRGLSDAEFLGDQRYQGHSGRSNVSTAGNNNKCLRRKPGKKAKRSNRTNNYNTGRHNINFKTSQEIVQNPSHHSQSSLQSSQQGILRGSSNQTSQHQPNNQGIQDRRSNQGIQDRLSNQGIRDRLSNQGLQSNQTLNDRPSSQGIQNAPSIRNQSSQVDVQSRGSQPSLHSRLSQPSVKSHEVDGLQQDDVVRQSVSADLSKYKQQYGGLLKREDWRVDADCFCPKYCSTRSTSRLDRSWRKDQDCSFLKHISPRRSRQDLGWEKDQDCGWQEGSRQTVNVKPYVGQEGSRQTVHVKPDVGQGDGGRPNPCCLNLCDLRAPRCMTLKQMKILREFWRLTYDNMWLSEVNQNLKLRLQHVRTTTFAESTRILDSVMAYCDAKAKATKNRKHVIGEARDRTGCREFSHTCGGYTPSGWNKLKSLGLLQDDDMLPENDRGFDGASVLSGPGGRGGEDDVKSERSVSVKDPPEQKSPGSVALSDGPGVPGSTRIRPEKRVGAGMGGGGFRPSARLLGEMCFQLERRILDYVFGLEGAKKRRFYGYTVSNICYMMEKESANPDGGSDVVSRTEMTCRLRKLLCALDKYGYDIKIHADFSQEIINKYGLLPSPPDQQTITTFGLNEPATVACLISRLSKRQSEVHNLNIILNCLHFLSTCDGRTLFVW